ncbi:MAG: tetratricopeptide repeat protein [Anaerolineae bacterium]|nr:tetratricopeptide repeat protein [Anaerolineae bacterium]
MFWLLSRLRRDVRLWDRATRIAFAIGGILLIVAVGVALVAPPDARLPVLVGAALLLVVLEIAVLWGNRGMVSAFTRAQRLYLDGELEAARDLLEAAHEKITLAQKKSDARSLVLLGNVYRQLGQLRESEAVLSEAVDKAPQHYFSFYGFGRTLLSGGRYAEAAEALRRALELGAPNGVQVDLAEAYFRMNQPQEAAAALNGIGGRLSEPHRALMAAYLLYRLGAANPPPPDVIQAGLPYWQAVAERFRETPYGAALQVDVVEMLKQGTNTHG